MLLIGKHSLRRLCRHDVGIDGRRSRDRQPIGAAGQELVRIAGGRECWDNRDVGRAIRRKPLQGLRFGHLRAPSLFSDVRNRARVNENSSLSLGVHKIPPSEGMAGSHRGLASYSRNKQGRPPVCNRDEKIRCGGVSAVLKTAGWRQSEGGL
jgi:hypothetical protein